MKPARAQKDTNLHPFVSLSLIAVNALLSATSEIDASLRVEENTSESTAACAACLAGLIAWV